MRARRERGDELGALRAELDLAELEIRARPPALAAELAQAALGSSVAASSATSPRAAELCVAAIDLLELRLDAALPRLEELHGQPALDAPSAAPVPPCCAAERAPPAASAPAPSSSRRTPARESRDELDRRLAAAEVALAAGDVGVALEPRATPPSSPSAPHRTIELAAALVIVARLELARGDRGNARAAATRAAREAAAAGLVRAARPRAARAVRARARRRRRCRRRRLRPRRRRARDAAPACRSSASSRTPRSTRSPATRPSPTRAAPAPRPWRPTAIEGAARLLTDLGLTAQRPFRVIDAEGVASDVADANPEILRLPARALAVDGVREVIWRHGQELADLRRRSLLKRLLFLFASAPGKVFSKEAIVQAVWNVEYHPLRHDAALFTNIMRIRRLLGEDGSEIIRVTEDGYRFVPPKDFVFVYPVA